MIKKKRQNKLTVVDLHIRSMMAVRRLQLAALVLVVICTTISKAQNITNCISSCGDIHNITFPFRLKADPKNCGDSRFQLDCQNNRTVISLESRKYNVLEINYDKFLIRAIDLGLVNQTTNCTSFPNYFTKEVPSTSPFDYFAPTIPIIYVNCLATLDSSRYVKTTFCGSQNKTSFFNSSQSHSYVAIGEDMSITDLAENCSMEIVAWASARGLWVIILLYRAFRMPRVTGFSFLGSVPSCVENVKRFTVMLEATAIIAATSKKTGAAAMPPPLILKGKMKNRCKEFSVFFD
ncbi:PREDICTED: uncharacterized protein LOC109223526 [Nicotiana attenuata]|uniref:uncharacterized protein LOC109223526 n=1 Tax=Nicotiana attenuata TaxID=49451 RepID=UPI000905B729|nr:PREDICTED: uncharacterized protein LOC109223526 [Nicotiana attenuata]